jgi:hypothetical protein
MTQGALTHASLKAKQRALRKGFPETMGLRVHRAISWIGRAEREADDPDAAFVFLWIAFNAAYADETLFHDRPSSERGVFSEYFARLVALDRDNRIYAAIWQRFSGPIRLLMANRYLFNPFWEHHNGIDGYADWPDRFDKAGRAFATALQAGDTARILSFLFDRLYVLRNQLVHGGATWGGSVNRAQVGDGARILGFLMPVFVDLMMDNLDADWGSPFYPVVTEP